MTYIKLSGALVEHESPETLIATTLRRRRMAGFWQRVEDGVLRLQRDRTRMARLFLIAYWVSLAVVLLGAVLILLQVTGTWSP